MYLLASFSRSSPLFQAEVRNRNTHTLIHHPKHPQNQPGSGKCPHRKIVVFDICHGSNGLFLLKLIIITLLWIHTVHLMSSLTHWGHWALIHHPNTTGGLTVTLQGFTKSYGLLSTSRGAKGQRSNGLSPNCKDLISAEMSQS